MPDSSVVPSLDLAALARLYEIDDRSPVTVLTWVISRLAVYPDSTVWIQRAPREEILAQAHAVEQRRARGENLPLYGVPFAVKDNIDVAGCPTTAGCPAFGYSPQRSNPVVARLLEAGAVFVGKTNMDQFATGLAGDRSPHGACRNPIAGDHISGGSSSGSAVAVAAGLVSFALGTDTAGSGRIPAGCNNIVGLKPTPGLLETEGVVPACRSLDCLSIFALTAEDALRVWEVGQTPDSETRFLQETGFLSPEKTFAVPRPEDLEFFGDAPQAQLFQQALGRLETLGWRRVAVDFRPFREVGNLLYEGPWLAERLAAVSEFLKRQPEALHPVTRAILEGGAAYNAVDVFQANERLQSLRAECLKVFDAAQVLVVPTFSTLPTLAQVKEDSRLWGRRLGTYTNFVNLLRLAAIALPAGFTPRGLPGGITVIGPAGSDRRLCDFGMTWQRRTNLPLGATGQPLPEPTRRTEEGPLPPVPRGQVRVAVAGAHLRGQPLHPDLLRMGGRFVRACKTAARYRFLAFMDLSPPRPGLLRDHDRAGAVNVELFDLPFAGFGMLTASVAPPLAIGTIDLADGTSVKGFLCESWPARQARDITEFGGWVPFCNQLAQGRSDSRGASRKPAREGP